MAWWQFVEIWFLQIHCGSVTSVLFYMRGVGNQMEIEWTVMSERSQNQFSIVFQEELPSPTREHPSVIGSREQGKERTGDTDRFSLSTYEIFPSLLETGCLIQ